MTECPSQLELEQLLAGTLEGRHESIESHVVACESCLRLVTELEEPSDEFVDVLRWAGKALSDSDANPDRTTLPRRLDSAESFTVESNSSDVAFFSHGPSGIHCPVNIGRFLIKEPLGAGGFGIVYRALDPLTGRDVAVKVPKPEALASLELTTRFLHEAKAAASLDHPNIVAVLESGMTEGGPYIAFGYHAGLTLGAWLQQESSLPTPRAAAALLQQLAEGVAHAHVRGVLHRDIKPPNVLMTRRTDVDPSTETGGWTPKLMDFGIAKSAESTSDLTRSGAIIGTVRYMAPEQAEGRGKDVTAATDVYGLGAILYQLLTGRVPFGGESDVVTLRAIIEGQLQSVASLRKEVPRDLRVICETCLRRSPAQRYRSATELADDLARFLEHRPIQARPVSALERGGMWVRRNRVAASVAVISAASVIALIAILILWNIDQGRLNRALRAQTQKAVEGAYTAAVARAHDALEKHQLAAAESILSEFEALGGEIDPRGVEWDYLNKLIETNSKEIGVHGGHVWAVEYSPDGSRLATGCADGGVRMFESATGRLLWSNTFPGEISGLSFSPDGRLIAAAAGSGEVVLCDSAKGGIEGSLDGGHTSWVADVDFSPDGASVCSAGSDGRLVLWDFKSRAIRRSVPVVDNELRAARYSRDGRHVCTAAIGGSIEVWDAVTGDAVATLKDEVPDHEGPSTHWPTSFSISKSGRRLASTVAHDGGVLVWDITDVARPRFIQHMQMKMARCIAFDGEESLLVGFEDGSVDRFDLESKEKSSRLAHRRQVVAIDVSPDRRSFATGGRDATARQSPQIVPEDVISQELPRIRRFALSPNGREIALAVEAADHVKIIGVHSGETLQTMSVSGKAGVSYSMDGRYLATLAESGELRVWDRVQNTLVGKALQLERDNGSIMFSPTKNQLVLVVTNKARCISVPELSSLWEVSFETAGTCVMFRTDGRRVYIAEHEGPIHDVDADTGRILRTLVGHADAIPDLAIDRENRILASSCIDGTTYLWDLNRGVPLRTLIADQENLGSLSFSGDGRTLVSLEAKDRIVLWHVGTGQRLLQIKARTTRCLQPSADGNGILALSDRGDASEIREVSLLRMKR